MCGIAGILRVHPPGAPPPPPEVAIPEAWLDILDESIKHRGPDGQGRFRDRAVRADGTVVDVALVHRRLAIIDLKDGHQPMVSVRARRASGGPIATEEGNAHTAMLFQGGPRDPVRYRPLESPTLARGARQDGTGLVAVVFNGCIYNHRELRKELQAAGHRFETDHSDTEVLVHGWREWGPTVLERADGMFTIALWDRSRAILTLARDGFGEKPLYYAAGTRGDGASFTVLASCAPGVVAIQRRADIRPANSALVDSTWVKPWIQFGWNQSQTPFSNVRELFPGQVQSWPPSGKESFAHGSSCEWVKGWAGDLSPTYQELDKDKLDNLLRRAVESRLDADVPLGCFLSGGLDSSLIAWYASRARPELATYTVRMPDPALDESEHAAAAARVIGVHHHILDCDPRPSDDLPALVRQLGLPFGDSSLLPTYWVCRAARREVRVALSGDGGDELFLGYDRHRAMRWLIQLQRLPRSARTVLAAATRPRPRARSLSNRLSRLVNASVHNGYKDLVAIYPPPLDAELGLASPGSFGIGAIQHWGLTNTDVRTMLRFDRLFYLPCDLLRKTDTASMSVALEVRAPMLESNLAHAAVYTHHDRLMPRGQRKGLLRQVARKYLPAEIVDRPKMGFAIPIGEWFRSDYGGMKQLLMDHLNSAEPWGPPSLGIDLNMKFVRQMLDEHMGTGPSGRIVRDHSQRLYMLLVLSIWAKWIGSL